jgi:cytochrome c peroxidase
MGYSGTGGRPDINGLISNLKTIDYYKLFFSFFYGNSFVTMSRLQHSLSHFIRSIQSFDSKFDIGQALFSNNNSNFPHFNTQENLGKALFLSNPVFDQNGNRIAGGVGCNNCHRALEFDIDPNSRNNGFISTVNSLALDLTIEKALA